MGANDYVTKPLDFPVVLARVQTQLQLKRFIERNLVLEHELSERNAALEAANESLMRAAQARGSTWNRPRACRRRFCPRSYPTWADSLTAGVSSPASSWPAMRSTSCCSTATTSLCMCST